MGIRALRMTWSAVAVVAYLAGAVAAGQEPLEAPSQPTFRAGVDLVTVRAVVRDGKGRPVLGLEESDFQLLDRGIPREIKGFDSEPGPIGIALLFDVSGSMDVAAKLERAREAAFFLLSSLKRGQDEAAIFAFDSRLHVVQPFTTEIDAIRGRLSGIDPWGVTALHDAIAAAAGSIETKGTRRRALVVLTDGVDTSSRLTPAEVSRIASAIDLPVYILALVDEVDVYGGQVGRKPGRPETQGTLADLARWTGGHLFVTTAAAHTSQATRRMVEELRHQYLLAFEPGREPGWHPLEVRTRFRGHVVQARSGYVAGTARPATD